MAEAARALPARFTFIGGHPLAGAAQGGLEHARPDLFSGRPWLLTPASARADEARASARQADDLADPALLKLTEFVQALGAVPRVLGVQAHDRLLAFLSHLPQLTASALMTVVGDAVGKDGLDLAGRGLADTTRLASSPPDIWRDIAATNADEIGPALDALIALLQDLRRDLPDGDQLADVFNDAARWRAGIKK
jgi:prephenate dehydrogenase